MMSIKKIIGMFVSTVILLNVGMPIFAYSSVTSRFARSDTFEVHVAKDSSNGKLMNIDLGNEKISLSLDHKTLDSGNYDSEVINKSESLSKGDIKQIACVLPEVSVRYKKQEQGLKEDFILYSKAAQNTFDLSYDIGSLQAEQLNEQNILLIDRNGAVKTIISAPYMTDAKGTRSTDVSLKILNKKSNELSVKLTADYSWLQNDSREYPVEVDPRYDTFPTQSLKKDDNNEQVALLKNMLFEAGIGAGVSMNEAKRDMRNNIFSDITKRFVISFQREMDLTVTGVADSNTLAVLRMELERMRILDTQEHTEQFLRRAASRSSSETGGFFSSVADFFSRINLTDLLVTAGTVAVVTGVSVFCAPATAAGITYMLIGGAAIGATAGGISEYAQQRVAGREVDFGRVAIKAVGGAVKGAVCAIPGAGVGVAGNALLFGGIAVAGTSENLLCTVRSTGFSGEAVANALINGGAQGLVSIPAAMLARNLIGPQKATNLLNDKSSKVIEATPVAAAPAAGGKIIEDSNGKNKPLSGEESGGSKTPAEPNGPPKNGFQGKNTEPPVKPNNPPANGPQGGNPELPPRPGNPGVPIPGNQPNQIPEVITSDWLQKSQFIANRDAQNVANGPLKLSQQREIYSGELERLETLKREIQQGVRPPIGENLWRELEANIQANRNQLRLINGAANGNFNALSRLERQNHQNLYDVYNEQMRDKIVQAILRGDLAAAQRLGARIIDIWVEDDEELTGIRGG